MFNIEIVKKIDTNTYLWKILIWKHEEYIYIYPEWNCIGKIITQWIHAIDRIIMWLKNSTIFIMSSKMWWVVYFDKDNNTYVVREQLLLKNDRNNLVLDNPYNLINEYIKNRRLNKCELQEIKEDGIIFDKYSDKYSEWYIEEVDLVLFKEKLMKKIEKEKPRWQ